MVNVVLKRVRLLALRVKALVGHNFYAELIFYLNYRLHSVFVLQDNFCKSLIVLHIHHKNSRLYSHLRKYNLRFL